MTLAAALEDAHLFLHERAEVERLRLQFQPTLLDALHVDEVADEPLQPPRLVGDDREVFLTCGFVHRPRLQQRRVAENARERRAHLVGDDADQLGAQALRLT